MPMNWKALIDLVGPVAGTLAQGDPMSKAAFLKGYQDADAQRRELQQHQAEIDRRNNATGADYLLKVGEHAQTFDDPVALSQFLSLADEAGAHARYTKPGDLKNRFTVPATKIAEKRLNELTAQLDALERGGYNLDELAQSGSHVRLKDGTDVPVASAIDLTRKRPIDATGTPIAKPQKLDTTQTTEEERFTAKWAKDRNKKVSDLTSNEELQARSAFRAAGRGPANDGTFSDYLTRFAKEQGTTSEALTTTQVDEARKRYLTADHNPQLDDMNLALKQLQLDSARQKAKEAGAGFQVQPNSREERMAQQLASGDLTFSDFNRLMGARSQTTIDKKLAIYDKAMELNSNFKPAAFEMGYKFASSPKVQAQIASINNVLTGVPDLLRVSDAATRSGATTLNAFVLRGGIAVGGRKYSDFKTAQIAFADELSGALGYGSATDMSREMGFDMTNPNLSPANFRSALETVIVPFVQRKKTSMLGQMGPYGNPDQNPGAKDPTGQPPNTNPANTASGQPKATHRFNPVTGKLEVIR